MSDERATSIKMTCVKLGIDYVAIPKEFEVRFLAYLDDANNVFCRMAPAYYHYFHDLQLRNPDKIYSIFNTLTQNFEITSFAHAMKPILEALRILDKALQS